MIAWCQRVVLRARRVLARAVQRPPLARADRPSVASRGDAELAAERVREVALVGVPDGMGDLHELASRGPEEPRRLGQAQRSGVFADSAAERATEAAGQLRRMNVDPHGQLGESNAATAGRLIVQQLDRAL